MMYILFYVAYCTFHPVSNSFHSSLFWNVECGDIMERMETTAVGVARSHCDPMKSTKPRTGAWECTSPLDPLPPFVLVYPLIPGEADGEAA